MLRGPIAKSNSYGKEILFTGKSSRVNHISDKGNIVHEKRILNIKTVCQLNHLM